MKRSRITPRYRSIFLECRRKSTYAETTNTPAVGAGKHRVRQGPYLWCNLCKVQYFLLTSMRARLLPFIGANGAGNNSCSPIAGFLVKPDSGTITLDEKPVGQRVIKIVEVGLALCPEGRRVSSRMSVAETGDGRLYRSIPRTLRSSRWPIIFHRLSRAQESAGRNAVRR